MVDPQLLAYVAQQRTAGYSDEQIAQALEAQGYPASLVNAALKDATMAALRSYVDTYRAQGYADLQIRQGLVQQGHTARDIDAVLGRGAHASKALLLFPIIAILILAGGYYLLNSDSGPGLPPDDGGPVVEKKSLGDIVERVIAVSRENAAAAAALCTTIDESDLDLCLKVVGQESGDPGACKEIDSDAIRDECYLPYVYRGRYELCDRMKLQSNIEYCETQKILPKA